MHPSGPASPHTPFSPLPAPGIFASSLKYIRLYFISIPLSVSCLLPGWPFWEKWRRMDPPPNGELLFDGGQGLAAAGLWAWVERAGRLGEGRSPIGLSSCAYEARGTRFSLLFPSCLPGGDCVARPAQPARCGSWCYQSTCTAHSEAKQTQALEFGAEEGLSQSPAGRTGGSGSKPRTPPMVFREKFLQIGFGVRAAG